MRWVAQGLFALAAGACLVLAAAAALACMVLLYMLVAVIHAAFGG